MDKKKIVFQYWKDVICQNADNLKQYFLPQASIKWHNTNELFSVG